MLEDRRLMVAAKAAPGKRLFVTLDGMRGVAACIVAYGHIQTYFEKGHGTEGYLAVDLFFLLSGVVIANAYERRLQSGLSAGQFIRIRLIRFYPLYLAGTAIGFAAVLLGFGWREQIGNLAVDAVLASVMTPNASIESAFPLNPPAWSLFCELIVNIIYGFLWRSLTIPVLAAIIGSCALGLGGIIWLEHGNLNIGWTVPTLYAALLRVGFSFFAGVLLYRLTASRLPSVRESRRFSRIPWVILAVVAIALGAPQPAAPASSFYDLIVVVLLFPSIVFAAMCFEPQGRGATVCRSAGRLSYALYAVHMPTFWLFGVVLLKLFGVTGETVAPWSGFAFIAVLAPFCMALDKYYDVPLRRVLTSRAQRQKLA